MAHPYWPLFDLEVRTERVTLRPPSDDDLVGLAASAAGGIHEPSFMPFLTPWTDLTSPALERSVMQWAWRHRGALTPAEWDLGLAVFVDGEPVGVQGVGAKDFAVRRSVRTGSWLAQRCQGQGLGREMRAAVLQLAFDGFGADEARSGAFADNPRSIGVSESLGYERDGTEVVKRRDERVTEVRFVMTQERFAERRLGWPPAEIVGVEACRSLLGLDPAD